MKRFIFTTCLGGLGLFYPACAQSKYWTVGPTIAVDRYRVDLPNGVIGATVTNPLALAYGFDFSFTTQRLLTTAKLLTSKRVYYYTQGFPINPDPSINTYLTVSAQHFIIPLSLSYRMFSSTRFNVFVGGGMVGEWLPNGHIGRVTNEDRVAMSGRSFRSNSEKEFQLGGAAQAVFRYQLTDRFLISVEPSYRLFSKIAVPLGYTNKHGFSGLITLSRKL